MSIVLSTQFIDTSKKTTSQITSGCLTDCQAKVDHILYSSLMKISSKSKVILWLVIVIYSDFDETSFSATTLNFFHSSQYWSNLRKFPDPSPKNKRKFYPKKYLIFFSKTRDFISKWILKNLCEK